MRSIMWYVYKRTIGISTITGSICGLYYGRNMALSSCFKKNHLSPIEYAGEVMCYSGITLSGGMVYGVLSGLCVATAPLSIPLIYYVSQDKDATTRKRYIKH